MENKITNKINKTKQNKPCRNKYKFRKLKASVSTFIRYDDDDLISNELFGGLYVCGSDETDEN